MANECCANCTKCLELVQFDYLPTGKVVRNQMRGYICLMGASEGDAIWVCGLKPEEERCEEFVAKENAC